MPTYYEENITLLTQMMKINVLRPLRSTNKKKTLNNLIKMFIVDYRNISFGKLKYLTLLLEAGE